MYRFWLSLDAELDRSEDQKLPFKAPSSVQARVRAAQSGDSVQLGGSGQSLVIPAWVGREYCGNVYLIVEMDSDNQLEEVDEDNNIKAIPQLIKCANGWCATRCFSFLNL